MTGLRHVIVTRFSIKLRAHADREGFPEGWLAQRVALFKRYCLPGMARQSCPDFTWLLLCDGSTDTEILEELRALSRTVPQLQLGVIGAGQNWRHTLNEVLSPSDEVILTTRLDSDDALHVDAVGILQEYGRLFTASNLDSLVVNFERGWQLETTSGTVSERWYPHSPFLTLIERGGENRRPRTVMHAGHTRLPRDHVTHHDLSIVGWLQVVHGGNVSNSIVDAGLMVQEADLSQFGLGDEPRRNSPASPQRAPREMESRPAERGLPGSRVPSREVARAYRVLLGREATREEIEEHHASDHGLRAIVADLTRTDEHARNLERPPRRDWHGALAGSDAAARLVPPGTVSADERAIAGEDGYLFIYRGANSTFRQFAGETPLKPEVLQRWETVLEQRSSAAAGLGARLICLVVPDKLAVLPDAFPKSLVSIGPRPIEQLLAAFSNRLLYPAEALIAAGEDGQVAYRTDSHLSLQGAQTVYSSTMEQFGLGPAVAALECDHREVLRSSGLGKGFSPHLYDVQDIPDPAATAKVESNEGSIGLHRGIVRVSRNPEAEHRAKIVVIGDSYCFPWRSGQLGSLIERSFAEAHFLWTAMGWDDAYLKRVRPDYVLLETAERFVVRPPELDSSFELSAVKPLAIGKPKGASPAVIDFAQASSALAARLSGYRSRVDITIAPGDAMYSGDLDDYLSVSYSAVAQIGHALNACGRSSPPRILDFACGHGRVLRALRAAFPEAELTACDVDRDGVDFCAAQFGALPVYSDPDPTRISLDGEFDLIWVGSLLTHLDAESCRVFLDLLRRHLAHRGLLVFSSHGRNAVKRWPADDERAQAIAADFRRRGFGYRDHHGVEGYGTSAFSAAWIADLLDPWTDLMLVGYVERGLADHQDVIAVLKTDVHHPQGDLLLK